MQIADDCSVTKEADCEDILRIEFKRLSPGFSLQFSESPIRPYRGTVQVGVLLRLGSVSASGEWDRWTEKLTGLSKIVTHYARFDSHLRGTSI